MNFCPLCGSNVIGTLDHRCSIKTETGWEMIDPKLYLAQIIQEAEARGAHSRDGEVEKKVYELEGSERAAEMHSNLNRRAAKALGKPFEGPGSSWHDIPECIERVMVALREIAQQQVRPTDDREKVITLLQAIAAKGLRRATR